MGRQASRPRFVSILLAGLAVWVFSFELSALLPSHPGSTSVFGDWPSEAVQLVSAALCALTAFRRRGPERLAWALVAAGIIVWTLGDVYWLTVLASAAAPPSPSPADLGYLLFEPLAFAALVILVRTRISDVPRTLVADGVIVGLAAAAVSAAFIVQPVAEHATGGTLAVATNLAYPISDLALFGVVLAAITLRGWRLDRTWALLGAGILAFFAADAIYVVQSAHGTYTEPNLFDIGWTGSTVLFAAAAWAPATRAVIRVDRRGPWSIALPLTLALAAFGVALFRPAGSGDWATVALAIACMAAVMVRLLMTFHENVAMLNASRVEALTDALTGLRNRRALTGDLAEALATATSGGDCVVLAMFDLDGFKYYNDNFGHEAGDALLARLGRRLGRRVAAHGTAYRVGGDEFCALIRPGAQAVEAAVDHASGALAERGDGFAIDCSVGVAILPLEATHPDHALRLADQRMYVAKNGGRASAARQSKDALQKVVVERDPELASHSERVAVLAAAVARWLDLDDTDVEQVRDAAELHDIGKLAIPDAILRASGPLDAAAWQAIREHTLVGERMIAAAPSLARVAAMVRSSHERYDGRGYPDGLKADAIPLGARIVAVCDAFDAMVTPRSYGVAAGADAAVAELRRCARSQFDPRVVEAFCAVWADRAGSVTALRAA